MPRVLAEATIHAFARRYHIALVSPSGRPRTPAQLMRLIYNHEKRMDPPPKVGLYVNAKN